MPDEDPDRVENVGAIEVQKFCRQPGDGQFFLHGLLAGFRQRIEAVAGTATFHNLLKIYVLFHNFALSGCRYCQYSSSFLFYFSVVPARKTVGRY